MRRRHIRVSGVVLAVTVAMAAAAVTATAADSADSVSAPRKGGHGPAPASAPVQGQYIVLLKPGAVAGTSVAAVASGIAHAKQVRLGAVYRSAVRGFVVRSASPAQADAIRRDPRVASVTQDNVIRLADATAPANVTPANVTPTGLQKYPPWNLDRIDQPRLPYSLTYTYSTGAGNVHAYIIDTGIRATHSQFGGRASVGADFVGDGLNGADCIGHGTHVAGIIGGATYGVAKSVRLVAVRVFGCTGTTTESIVIAAVDWVTANGVKPAVVDMSLGGPVSEPLDAAVRGSIAAGFTYAIAAGNTYANPNTCDISPARVAEAITVAASTRDDQETQYTNDGPCVDMFAPGGGIPGEDTDPTPVTSAWYTSDTAAANISGTSMAAPHVAGAAALFLAWHPTATPSLVESTLIGRSTKNVLAIFEGFGTPNRLLYSYPPMLTVTRLDATPEPVTVGGIEVLRGYVYRSATGTRLPNRRVNIYYRRAGTTTWQYVSYRITNSTGNYLASFHQYHSGTWLAVHVGDELFHLSSASDTVYVR